MYNKHAVTGQPGSFGKQLGASAALLLATAIWGSTFVFMKTATDDLTPLYLIFFRFILAGAVSAAVFWKSVRQFRLWMIKPALITGGTLFWGLYLQTRGLMLTTASNSALISGTYVLFVPMITWLLSRETLQPNQIIFAVLAMLGIVILSVNEQLRFNSGDFWVLLGAIGFSAQIVCVDRYVKRIDPMLLNFLQLVVCALIAGVCALCFEPVPVRANFTGQLWFALIYCAIFATTLAYGIQIVAQRHIKPHQCSVLFTAESLFGAFFGWLLLGEVFSGRQWLGALLLFGSIVGVVSYPLLKQRKQQEQLS